jgi:AcrR family transcriptional regulator
VDHALRRQEIVQALWRVVRRDGIHNVSVRSVAAEAGTSSGAMRHYFASQDELLAFALRSVVERATDRVRSGPGGPVEPSGRTGAVWILEQLLPLDDDRVDEVAVYLAFLGRVLADPALRAVRDEVENISRKAVLLAVQMLCDAGSLGAGRDVERETNRLYPLLDGLALHGVQWPDRYPPDRLRAVLADHLESLVSDAMKVV